MSSRQMKGERPTTTTIEKDTIMLHYMMVNIQLPQPFLDGWYRRVS